MKFTDAVLITLYVLSYFVSLFYGVKHYIHMFQLNSYKVHVQLNWLNKKRKLYLSKTLPSILLIPILYFFPKIGCVTSAIFYLFIAYISEPKNVKKPLFYTNRVKRMLLTISIVTAALSVPSALWVYFEYNDNIFVLPVFACITALYFIGLPFIVLFGNYINRPIENAINKKFINEAKSIIKSMPDLKVIGITGSYGKTSVKYFLTKLLSSKFDVLMTPESYNTTMGVVRTIREQMRGTHRIFVCEMGARNIGDIKEICDIVHPSYGIITSIGPQHLESFHTIENIKKTKFELADSLPDDGMAFLNANDENIESVNYSRNKITYGIGKGDYSAFDLILSSKGTSFKVKSPNGDICEYQTKLVGEHNVQNITGAIAVSHFMGIALENLKTPIKKLESVPHRLELKKSGDITILDDAYNSNVQGTKASLKALSMFDGVKIIITPGMVELGERQDEFNYEFGKDCAAVCDYIILVGEEQTKSIAKGVLDCNYNSENLIICDTVQQAFSKLYSIDAKGKEKIALLENDLPDNFL